MNRLLVGGEYPQIIWPFLPQHLCVIDTFHIHRLRSRQTLNPGFTNPFGTSEKHMPELMLIQPPPSKETKLWKARFFQDQIHPNGQWMTRIILKSSNSWNILREQQFSKRFPTLSLLKFPYFWMTRRCFGLFLAFSPCHPFARLKALATQGNNESKHQVFSNQPTNQHLG